jgi:hypothetical protein
MINKIIHTCSPEGKERREESEVQGLYLKINQGDKNTYSEIIPTVALVTY